MVLAKISIEIDLMPPKSLISAMAEVLSHWKFIWTWLKFLYKAFRAKKMANNSKKLMLLIFSADDYLP